jgi:periplasmic divalent cation tolerance protein
MRLVVVTAPKAEAPELAKKIVEEQLAACVNIVPTVRSIYRWQGKIEDDEESLLLIKSTTAKIKPLTKRLLDLHSYDVPEIISIKLQDTEGNSDYLEWVRKSVDGFPP